MTGGPTTAKTIALTWEEHRRTRELCSWLEIPLHELTSGGSGLRRYWTLMRRTVSLLARERPAVVYVQNPSLVLSLIVLASRPFCGGYRVLMDAHNEAVAPFTHAYFPITTLTRIALRAADITIVTNAALAAQVRELGGTPLILPDRLPTPPFQATPPPPLNGAFQIMVVATYAADEPIAAIIEAGRILGDEFQFRITGRETKLPEAERARLPANVKQTGFLPEESYWELMRDSHVVLDLTLKPNCLVCGAYESLAMRRPMILTGNPASRDLFGQSATFPSEGSPEAIAASITHVRENYSEHVRRTIVGAQAFAEQWSDRAAHVREFVDQCSVQDSVR